MIDTTAGMWFKVSPLRRHDMVGRYFTRVLDFRRDPFFPSAWPVALWLALWNGGDY